MFFILFLTAHTARGSPNELTVRFASDEDFYLSLWLETQPCSGFSTLDAQGLREFFATGGCHLFLFVDCSGFAGRLKKRL